MDCEKLHRSDISKSHYFIWLIFYSLKLDFISQEKKIRENYTFPYFMKLHGTTFL